MHKPRSQTAFFCTLDDCYKILDEYITNYLEVYMISIKPVSDLRNYNEVLQDVTDDSPVFLTKNGRGFMLLFQLFASQL